MSEQGERARSRLLYPARRALERWRDEAKAVGWLVGSDSIGRLFAQVGVVVTARVLGPGAFGAVAVAMAVFGIAAVLADAGVGEAGVQQLTRRAGGEERFDREVAPLRLWLALPLVPIGLAVALVFDNASVRASGLLAAAVPLAALISGRSLKARVGERFPEVARWMAVITVGVWLGAMAGVVVDASEEAAGLGIALVLGAGALAAARRASLRPPSIDVARAWVSRGVPFLVTAGSVALYTRGDRVVVASIEGSQAAGRYAAAYNVVMVVAIAGASVHAALLPRLLHESRELGASRWASRARKVVYLTAPPAVALACFAPWLVETLYGDTYGSAGTALRFLSPLVILYLLNPFLTTTLVARGRQRAVAKVALANLVVAAAAYPLLTAIWGVQGTAGASVLVECTGLAIALTVLSRPQPGLVVPRQP